MKAKRAGAGARAQAEAVLVAAGGDGSGGGRHGWGPASRDGLGATGSRFAT